MKNVEIIASLRVVSSQTIRFYLIGWNCVLFKRGGGVSVSGHIQSFRGNFFINMYWNNTSALHTQTMVHVFRGIDHSKICAFWMLATHQKLCLKKKLERCNASWKRQVMPSLSSLGAAAGATVWNSTAWRKLSHHSLFIFIDFWTWF